MARYPSVYQDGRSYALRSTDGYDVGLYGRQSSGLYVPVRANTAAAPPSTRFGACLPQFAPGSTSSGTEQNVIDKFWTPGGPGVFLRKFAGVPTTTPPKKTVGASGSHYSCSFGIIVRGTWTQALYDSNNAMADAILAGNYNNQIDATFGPLDPDYWDGEILHEADTKTNGSQPFMVLSKAQALKEFAYNRIKAVNSALPVVNTFQAYGFSDSSPRWVDGTFRARWGSSPCDIVGADFDAVQPGYDDVKNADGTTTRTYKLPYPALLSNRDQNIMQWVIDLGLDGWDIPEWGVYTNAIAADSEQTILAQWMINMANRWLALAIPPRRVCWYDYGPNPEGAATTLSDVLSKPASINALKGMILGSNAPAYAA